MNYNCNHKLFKMIDLLFVIHIALLFWQKEFLCKSLSDSSLLKSKDDNPPWGTILLQVYSISSL